jgi:hypothetical protein
MIPAAIFGCFFDPFWELTVAWSFPGSKQVLPSPEEGMETMFAPA